MIRFDAWQVVIFAIAALAAGGLACAQSARTGGNANAQALQQMQQLASERTALQGENDKLKAQLAAMTKERDALKAGQQAVEHRAQEASAALTHSASQREATERELAQSKAKMQELIGKFRETIQKLRDAEAENATAKQTLVSRERELASCVEHNQALYHLNDEVLTHLEHQGLFTRMAASEPFTRIKRTQLQNYADESRSKAQEQLITPSTPPATEASAPTQTPPPAPH